MFPTLAFVLSQGYVSHSVSKHCFPGFVSWVVLHCVSNCVSPLCFKLVCRILCLPRCPPLCPPFPSVFHVVWELCLSLCVLPCLQLCFRRCLWLCPLLCLWFSCPFRPPSHFYSKFVLGCFPLCLSPCFWRIQTQTHGHCSNTHGHCSNMLSLCCCWVSALQQLRFQYWFWNDFFWVNFCAQTNITRCLYAISRWATC